MRRLILLGTAMLLLGAGNASAAELRFVHAVPGAGAAELLASGEVAGSAGFGEAGQYARVPGGEVELSLRAQGEEEELVSSMATLGDGRNTVVAVPKGEGVELRVYEDGEGSAGAGRLRVIHAVPELEQADVQLDGRNLTTIAFGDATGYEDVDPGTYTLALTRPGGEGGALVEDSGVDVTAGAATTAIAVGSRGEPTRFVIAEDAAVAPADGPDTGLGGLAEDGGPPWAAAIAAALLAGALGGGAWLLMAARRRS
jgi:hypothetical protein